MLVKINFEIFDFITAHEHWQNQLAEKTINLYSITTIAKRTKTLMIGSGLILGEDYSKHSPTQCHIHGAN
jgi:hypothetical protein